MSFSVHHFKSHVISMSPSIGVSVDSLVEVKYLQEVSCVKLLFSFL